MHYHEPLIRLLTYIQDKSRTQMAFHDLREWIKCLEGEGELFRIKTEVDWDLEIGGIARENMDRNGPAHVLLVDSRKGGTNARHAEEHSL